MIKYFNYRKSIAIIPQDPILFTGTIRDNIDPYREYREDQIWAAISKVKIKAVIPSLEARVRQNGIGFSVGQKQLICLARAALRQNKIVILDEATANMDAISENLLYELVEEAFEDCTILIIAHRIDYIRRCDRVMVIDAGSIVEYDNPNVLLNNSDSEFAKICREVHKRSRKR